MRDDLVFLMGTTRVSDAATDTEYGNYIDVVDLRSAPGNGEGLRPYGSAIKPERILNGVRVWVIHGKNAGIGERQGLRIVDDGL